MEMHHFADFQITVDKQGATRYARVTYPLRYGCYSEIRTDDYIFQFDLNGRIKYIQGRRDDWPDRNEWLKRTISDDWVYYASGGGYNRIYSFIGEYYLPCFSYSTNTVFRQVAFRNRLLPDALAAFAKLRKAMNDIAPRISEPRLKAFFDRVAGKNPAAYASRRQQFYSLLGGPISVLPPDTRHVDYNVIPVILADGCLYDCGFCRVKSGRKFRLRDDGQILNQINGLRDFFDLDLANYNAVFLGQHDALFAGEEAIEFAARKAYEGFQLDRSNLNGRFLFLFGSVDSMLRARETLFSTINSLPYYTYINIGLESFDQTTLTALKKPIRASAVKETFARMQKLNRKYDNIEITANFVLGRDLPSGHEDSIIESTRNSLERYYSKGTLYLSPLDGLAGRKQLKKKFLSIKTSIPLSTYLYLIQRL